MARHLSEAERQETWRRLWDAMRLDCVRLGRRAKLRDWARREAGEGGKKASDGLRPLCCCLRLFETGSIGMV